MLELGILKTFDTETHKAGVQLAGSLTTYLDDIAVATNIAPEAMTVGNYVLVAIPGGNPRDACIVASWPAGSSGIRDHGELSGLAADDHSQYLNIARHDLPARHPLANLDPLVCSEAEADSKITTHKNNASAHHTKTTSSEIDHGSVQGLGDDDHAQYLNVARHDLTARHPLGSVVPHEPALDNVGDVTAPSPTRDECLKFNGSIWVPAVYNYSFTFSIATFSDGQGTLLLIGNGVWKAIGAIVFAATYNNGPPDPTPYVSIHSNGGVTWNNNCDMDAPGYTAGASKEATNYPSAKDLYIRFQLHAAAGEDSDTLYEAYIYFRNHIRWGVATKNSGFTEADVEGLAGSAISNDQTRSMSINAGAGQYLVFAFPSTYTSIPDGDDYEDDGGSGFKFNNIACAFKPPETVSITNSAGYQENYKVYASYQANLGYHTLVTSTSNTQINPLYYGKTTKTSGFTEADVEGLEKSEITNDNTQVWDSITTGENEYMLFAFPKRLGIPTFWVGGFEGGFESPETVSVTNSNGWTEDYYVWRSSNSNLGPTVVETK